MKFRSVAVPGPWTPPEVKWVRITVPDDSMSLKEIVERFVRGEPVPVGREVSYHESDDDLEKVAHMDLVDRDEYIEKQKEIQRKFEKQEKRKKAERARRLEDQEREKAAAKVAGQMKAEKPEQGDPLSKV